MRTRSLSLVPLGIAILLGLVACSDDGGSASETTSESEQRYSVFGTVVENEESGRYLCLSAVSTGFYPRKCDGPALIGFEWEDVQYQETGRGARWGHARLVGTYDGETFTLTEPAAPAAGPGVVDFVSVDFAPACDDPAVVIPGEGLPEWDLAYLTLGEFDDAVQWVSDERLGWDGPFAVNLLVLPGAGDQTEALIREHYGGPLCVVERGFPTERDLAKVQRQLRDDDARPALGTVYLSGVVETRGVVTATIALVDDAAHSYAAERWGDLVELDGLIRPVD